MFAWLGRLARDIAGETPFYTPHLFRPPRALRPSPYWISDLVDSSESTPLLAKYPERSAGQAGGIPKYRRLALLDTYVLWLAKAERPSHFSMDPSHTLAELAKSFGWYRLEMPS